MECLLVGHARHRYQLLRNSNDLRTIRLTWKRISLAIEAGLVPCNGGNGKADYRIGPPREDAYKCSPGTSGMSFLLTFPAFLTPLEGALGLYISLPAEHHSSFCESREGNHKNTIPALFGLTPRPNFDPAGTTTSTNFLLKQRLEIRNYQFRNAGT